MARTVFILGAGTSAAAGAPLMNQFLRFIRDLYESGKVSDNKNDFELILRAHSLLQSTYAKMRMNYEDDIEELFATFEMIRILASDNAEQFSDLEPENLTSAMRRAIGATIEQSMLFNRYTRDTAQIYAPHQHYETFVRLLRDLSESGKPDSSVAILSFNYDLGLDYALEHEKFSFHYSLHDDDEHKGIAYLKLHGSLNWGICSVCKEVVSYSISDYQKNHPILNETTTPLLVSKNLSDLIHCGQPLSPEPYLVPPTWNKTEYQKTIANVWTDAYKELSGASNIIVCGYSFPQTDQFFRHLLAISLSSGTIIDRFLIVNPNRAAYESFASILSESVQKVLEHFGNKFEDSFYYLRDRLGIPL